MKAGPSFHRCLSKTSLNFVLTLSKQSFWDMNETYVTAMICIDYKHVGKWAEDNRIIYTTYSDLAGKQEVYDLIEREVVRVNATLPEKARIKNFFCYTKNWIRMMRN